MITARMKRRAATLASILVLGLGSAATAWACTALATLDLSAQNGPPGRVIEGVGDHFSINPLSSPVEIRWNGSSGQMLASVRPALDGSIDFEMSIPDVDPGQYYVVAAYQYDAFGDPIPGTPSRVEFYVESE